MKLLLVSAVTCKIMLLKGSMQMHPSITGVGGNAPFLLSFHYPAHFVLFQGVVSHLTSSCVFWWAAQAEMHLFLF